MSPPHDKNVTHNNTINNTSKNLPLLFSKENEIATECDSKEEEDFSFLSIYQLSAKQIKDLKAFPSEKVKESMELAWKDNKIKSKVGWALTRLRNPENFKTAIENQYSQNQLLALQHNEFLKTHIPDELYKKNKEDILKNGFMTAFHKNGLTTTFSCKDSKHDVELSADIEISQEGAKNRQVMRKRK